MCARAHNEVTLGRVPLFFACRVENGLYTEVCDSLFSREYYTAREPAEEREMKRRGETAVVSSQCQRCARVFPLTLVQALPRYNAGDHFQKTSFIPRRESGSLVPHCLFVSVHVSVCVCIDVENRKDTKNFYSFLFL